MIALASKLNGHSLTSDHDPAEEARTIARFEQDFWTPPCAKGAKCFAISSDWWMSWRSYTAFEISDSQTANVKVSSDLRSIDCHDCLKITLKDPAPTSHSKEHHFVLEG